MMLEYVSDLYVKVFVQTKCVVIPGCNEHRKLSNDLVNYQRKNRHAHR